MRFNLTESETVIQVFKKSLPFELTTGQNQALNEILEDLNSGQPMNRLIQGDVGSGKTLVAILSAAVVLSKGHQVALMAPTEILAEQHLATLKKFFPDKLSTGILLGKSTASERRQLQARLESGEPMLTIGTHALIEDAVKFKNLKLVLIDEQHRFGVEQRLTLKQKGFSAVESQMPHMLVLTATPIPRTLALTVYGDLSVSSIRELPKGRSAIITKLIQGEARLKAYEHIRQQVSQGRQVYVIYPLVSDSEAEGFTNLKSAVTEFERLAHEVFPEFKLGLLHGQMKPDEKALVMESFKKGETAILVSTTVVEVGVDVPNATVMVIEHSERFGLSQIHQLRGRVGRGMHQSYCFLFADNRLAEETKARLQVLERTSDGFKIAEADLEARGPGEFLGTRQSGSLPFKLGDLVRDQELLFRARDDAQSILKSDPELRKPDHLPLRRYFEREGQLQADILGTS